MTVKEHIDILRESSLWHTLSLREKAEAMANAMGRSQQMPTATESETADTI